jgi:tetratricopeptide (TPR) repeat protein
VNSDVIRLKRVAMRAVRLFSVLSVLFFLAGCAGVGVVASSDPLTKLNDAEYLFMHEDRPLIAERLIREAIVIYQEQDDPQGLGNAHREYADLLLSPSVTGKWQKFYRENGFQDKSITFETREAKASEYYTKALEYYARAELKLREANRFDSLTNVYFNMGWSAYRLDDRAKSCAFYDKALEAYTENIKHNPDAKPYSPTGSVPKLIEAQKKRVGCE